MTHGAVDVGPCARLPVVNLMGVAARNANAGSTIFDRCLHCEPEDSSWHLSCQRKHPNGSDYIQGSRRALWNRHFAVAVPIGLDADMTYVIV